MDYPELEKIMRRELLPFRFRHSLAVGRLAAMLGARHGWDSKAARIAGLLHDCARGWPTRRLVSYARRCHLRVPNMDFVARNAPILLHDAVGAHYAREKGWTKDPAVVKAIRSHTLGEVSMTREQMILFVADCASEDRAYPAAAVVRREALSSLDRGFQKALVEKIKYQIHQGRPLHPITVLVWNAFGSRPPAN